MLVHKRTMGVLCTVWTGEYIYDRNLRHNVPKRYPATFENVPYISKDEWWEIDGYSKLGGIIKKWYPYLDPIIDNDGNLVDVIVTADTTRAPGRQEYTDKRKKASSRRNRPSKNALTFLKRGIAYD